MISIWRQSENENTFLEGGVRRSVMLQYVFTLVKDSLIARDEIFYFQAKTGNVEIYNLSNFF